MVVVDVVVFLNNGNGNIQPTLESNRTKLLHSEYRNREKTILGYIFFCCWLVLFHSLPILFFPFSVRWSVYQKIAIDFSFLRFVSFYPMQATNLNNHLSYARLVYFISIQVYRFFSLLLVDNVCHRYRILFSSSYFEFCIFFSVFISVEKEKEKILLTFTQVSI